QNHVSKLKMWQLFVWYTDSWSMVKTQFQRFKVQSFASVLAVVLFFGAYRVGQSRVCFWLQFRSVSLSIQKPIYSLK
ncbi:TPA: hypothetical protein ACMDT5_004645, partial [Vibrio parahaemolyticus]